MADRILLRRGHVLAIDRKRDGKLTGDWDSARKRVETSSAYPLDALAKKKQESAGS